MLNQEIRSPQTVFTRSNIIAVTHPNWLYIIKYLEVENSENSWSTTLAYARA